ncbi:MAG: DUF1877 family protein [Caulobacter sp.]|nr:DUF1877 family protein [Caulobacter sp.]
MSTVASYARMKADEVAALTRDPEQYWRLDEMPHDLSVSADVGASERLEIDKDWQVLSWLCSPLGRVEERQQAGLVAMDYQTLDNRNEPGVFQAALAKAVEKLGFRYLDPGELSEDPILKALQGRRAGDEGPSIADLGLAAAAFAPEEVRALAAALNSLEEDWLRERFDVREMETLGLPSDYEETELDEFYLPQLERLKALYNRAAAAGQHVVVVIY